MAPGTKLCQASQFEDGQTLVLLTYSKQNDMYFMLGVEIVGGRFTLVDTIQFKKGHIIHGFNIQNVSKF